MTIGEKLYGESLELLRELISNAYDADATEVYVELLSESLVVRDNGSGMDEDGIREFFRIGSQNKQKETVSPVFKRRRIGQFGIGKFAVLTACESFRVRTQKEDFSAEVEFDKQHWFEHATWQLPLRKLSVDPARGNGTIVILEKMKKRFDLADIERYIRERLPLDAPHFVIFLNGSRLVPRHLSGRRFPINATTPFGRIHGEFVLPNLRSKTGEVAGIECVVRGIVICRSTFGLENPLLQRIRGRVEADFLPITSDRSRFITDTPEYKLFLAVLVKELRDVAKLARDLVEKRERQKADLTLKDTLTRMRKAIRKNPDIALPVLSGTGEVDTSGSGDAAYKMSPEAVANDPEAVNAVQMMLNSESEQPSGNQGGDDTPAKKVRVKNLDGKTVVARSIKIGGIGITCSLEPCGRNEPPAFVEAGIIYINTDHSLYKKQQEKGQDMLGFYLSYLLSQQVALLLGKGDIYRAFDIQDRLLTDSW